MRPILVPDALPGDGSPDLPHAHILRSLANVKAVSVHTSHSGCHVVVLDIYGTAYLFGRNTSSCLGVYASAVPVISERSPRKLRPSHLGAPASTKFVNAACGRAHTLLVDDSGEVWSAGINTLGQVPSIPQLLCVNTNPDAKPLCSADNPRLALRLYHSRR
jgi:alpha-tubulin suppressor-like RCC1 family protein